MNKLIINNEKLNTLIHNILRQIYNSKFYPDYIVGISRGGLVPAVMISHYLNIPLKPLQVSLRDSGECVSDITMAEDAYNKKNILIVDDINDSGATFNWLIKDWQQSCIVDKSYWKTVWNHNVRFAVLVDNLSSECKISVDYSGMEINKKENDVWVDFSWETWWKNE